jgi:hypothetical protein
VFKIEVIDEESSMYVIQDIKFLISDLKVNDNDMKVNVIKDELILVGFKVDNKISKKKIYDTVIKKVCNLKRTFRNNNQKLIYYDNGFILELPYVCKITLVTSL